jgi:glucan biosynthesis protein C
LEGRALRRDMERKRLLFIDNLRTLMIGLVIILHLAVTYGGEGSWYYREGGADRVTSVLLSLHNGVVQSFVMGLIFSAAGYFTPGSCDRKGNGRFLRDRFLRLGIPMLAFDLVIEPIVGYTIRVSVDGYKGSFLEAVAPYYRLGDIGTGPPWFVNTLLMFSVAYVALRWVAGRLKRPGRTDGPMPGSLLIALFAVGVGLATFIVRIWLPIGTFGPLNLQFPFFAQYVCMYVVGVVAYRRKWLERIPPATGRLWQVTALALIFVVLPVLFVAGGGPTGSVSPYLGGLHWQCFAYTLWEQLLGVAVIMGLLALFRQKFNRQGKLTEAMSASSYTAYIIQTPVLVFFALAIRHVTMHPLLKFALASVVLVPLCFGIANIVRRAPLARRIM